jgi:hypothetical protein
MTFELTFVLFALASSLLFFAASTVFLVIWTGKKLRNLISGAGLEIKGVFDILCLLAVTLSFAFILPLGLVACIFCKPTAKQ